MEVLSLAVGVASSEGINCQRAARRAANNDNDQIHMPSNMQTEMQHRESDATNCSDSIPNYTS